jgi:hypothetical protein
MRYPASLTPSTVERFTLSDGSTVSVPKVTPTFHPWDGPAPGDTYGGKAVVNASGQPAFAELAILDAFRADGWDGVWIDTYRNKFRTGFWDSDPLPTLPSNPGALLRRILEARGTGRSGTWDVYCWRGTDVVFAEAKRGGKDSIKPQQLTWLEAALRVGVPLESFLVVEWSLL